MFEAIRTYLASVHPALPATLLVLAIWLPQWLIRKYAPTFWEAAALLPAKLAGLELVTPAWRALLKGWQAIPSIVIGALLTALSTPDADAWTAVTGAMLGVLAPLWHELLKALPVPYQGGMPPATTKQTRIPPLGILILVLAFPALEGCTQTVRDSVYARALVVFGQAEQILDVVELRANAYLALLPAGTPEEINAKAAKQKQIGLALERAKLALSAAERAVAGSKALDATQVNEALVNFRQTYVELVALVESFAGAKAVETVPPPMALERFEAPQ